MNDLKKLWDDLPFRGPFAVVFAAWTALFHWLGNSGLGYVHTHSALVWVWVWYQLQPKIETGDGVCPLALAAFPMLIYLSRANLLVVPKRAWPPAAVLVALAAPVHVVGFLAQQPRLSLVAFLVGGFGLMGIVWGAAWLRAIAFPWFSLLFAIPIGAYTDGLTFHLRVISTAVSVAVCRMIGGLPLVRQGTEVQFGGHGLRGGAGFTFDVAPACSGIRSATAVVFITVLYAFLNHRTGWRRLALVLAAPGLAVAGNALRLTIVFIVGDFYGQGPAKSIETNLGFVTYAAALAGVYGLSRLVGDKTPTPIGKPPENALRQEPKPLSP